MIYYSYRKPYLIALFLLTSVLSLSSPFAFQVTPVRHLFKIEHAFLQPTDVAVGFNHQIYVLDGVNHCVKVFNHTGGFLSSFGGKGSAPGLFSYPVGIATDSQGRIYVADTGNHRVQIFTAQGTFISLIPAVSEPKEKPSDPVDVAVDEHRGRLYVVDNDNHHLLLYSLEKFNLIGRWGSEGKGYQQFHYPFLISTGKDTTVYVVDVLNTRVQVWSPQGKCLTTIGKWGVDLGQFYRPKGVCVDKTNTVFVSDSYLGVIQTFNRYGHFKSVLGNEEGKVMRWKTPVGITIDDRQRLYVVEMLANQVSVYEVLEKNIEGKE